MAKIINSPHIYNGIYNVFIIDKCIPFHIENVYI